VSMAQIAASIEYETAPPPAGLPHDMHTLPGASLELWPEVGDGVTG